MTANLRIFVKVQAWVSIVTTAVCTVFCCMLAGPYQVNAIWDMLKGVVCHMAYRCPVTLQVFSTNIRHNPASRQHCGSWEWVQ